MFDIQYDFPRHIQLAKAKKGNHTHVFLVRGTSAYHYICIHQQVFFGEINLNAAKRLVSKTISIANKLQYKNQDLLFECLNQLPEKLLHYFRKFPTFLDIATGHIKVTPRAIAYMFLFTFVHRGLRDWSCKKEMRIMTTRELMINNPLTSLTLLKKGSTVKGVFLETFYSVMCVDLMFDDNYYAAFCELFKHDLEYIWPLVEIFREHVTPFLLFIIMEKFDIYRNDIWNDDVINGLRSIFPNFKKLFNLNELVLDLIIHANAVIYVRSDYAKITFIRKMQEAVRQVKVMIHAENILE